MTEYDMLLQHGKDNKWLSEQRDLSHAQLRERQFQKLYKAIKNGTATIGLLEEIDREEAYWQIEWGDEGCRKRKMKAKHQAEMDELTHPTDLYGSFIGKDGKIFYYKLDEEENYFGV